MIATNLNRLICRRDLYKSYFVLPSPRSFLEQTDFP
jgi:hypothetical protein